MNYSKTVNQKFSMKKIVLAVMGLVALSAGANAQENGSKEGFRQGKVYLYHADRRQLYAGYRA